MTILNKVNQAIVYLQERPRSIDLIVSHQHVFYTVTYAYSDVTNHLCYLLRWKVCHLTVES